MAVQQAFALPLEVSPCLLLGIRGVVKFEAVDFWDVLGLRLRGAVLGMDSEQPVVRQHRRGVSPHIGLGAAIREGGGSLLGAAGCASASIVQPNVHRARAQYCSMRCTATASGAPGGGEGCARSEKGWDQAHMCGNVVPKYAPSMPWCREARGVKMSLHRGQNSFTVASPGWSEIPIGRQVCESQNTRGQKLTGSAPTVTTATTVEIRTTAG